MGDLVDGEYVLSVSTSVPDEQVKLSRVQSVPFVPKIHSSGDFTSSGRLYHCLVYDHIQGEDLWAALPHLSDRQQVEIGRDVATFLNELHAVAGSAYDIGHYIPTVPGYRGTWREGHLEYAEVLSHELSDVDLEPGSEDAIADAFDCIGTYSESLGYQVGPRLLHNDLHPKNLIVRDGRLAGVIDWECSQFGEPDFDLARLLHWHLHPPAPGAPLEPMLRSLIANLRGIRDVPNLGQRLTIYLLEHDLNQLVWHGKGEEEERVGSIKGWLNGGVDDLLNGTGGRS